MYPFTSQYLVADGNGKKHIIFQPTNEGIKNDEKLMSKFAIYTVRDYSKKKLIMQTRTIIYSHGFLSSPLYIHIDM